MLAAHDVIDLVRETTIISMQEAILATIARTPGDFGT
jgi:hypothetical protein